MKNCWQTWTKLWQPRQVVVENTINGTKSMFVDSGSLKSTLTWFAADLINETRQACGGHGYSSYNGFGKSYDDWVVQCTYEGDNNVLAMSAGKTIIKTVQQVLNGKPLQDSTLEFLNDAPTLSKAKAVIKLKNTLTMLTVFESCCWFD